LLFFRPCPENLFSAGHVPLRIDALIAMRVSAKAEYACVAMLELAASYGSPQPVRIKAIASTHGIPQRFLVQILLQLKGAGLVASTRGAAGGYCLTRPPAKISLADIIHVIDRASGPRPPPSGLPPSPAVQAVQSVWKDIQAEEKRMLEECTLAGLVGRIQRPAALSYQI
jgi:Rrf2 family protein